MTALPSPHPLATRVRSTARAVAHVALQGLPAVRAAMHGARLGAGRAFSPAVVEQLGVAVLPAAGAVDHALGRGAGEAALVLRAGARELVVHARDGLTLRISPTGGAAASVSHDAVRALARTGARGALAGIGRAAMQGATAGAVLDGALAGVAAIRAVRRGEMTGRAAARHVGKRTVRGAVAGAVGVAAAGAVSAGLAAVGLAIVGAPVAIPIATMVATDALATRAFDRLFGE
jgi:hypothetical protein